MQRTEKAAKIDDIHAALKDAQLVVVTHQQGMTAAEVAAFRSKMRKAGAGFKVTKNRLARIALKGTKFEGLDSLFTGPTAIALSQDPVAAAKAVYEAAKDSDKLKIVGAGLDAQVLDAAGTEKLAKLPPLNDLRAKLVGLLQTPASRIASILQAPGGQVARALAARGRQEA